MNSSEYPSNAGCNECQEIRKKPGAVLTREEIKHLVDKHEMIQEFSEECLQGTNYNLRIGKEYYTSKTGVKEDLHKKYFIEIPPFGLVAVSTYEKLKLPSFVIGRWSLKVTKTYEGIYWTGGPQVDAGYEGNLYCVIYNMTNERVVLRYREPFATIDFVVTKSDVTYPEEKKNRKLGNFLTRELRSGVEDLNRRVERMSNQINILFIILSIMIGIIAIIFTGSIRDDVFLSQIGNFLGISLIILALTLLCTSIAFLMSIYRSFHEWVSLKIWSLLKRAGKSKTRNTKN